MFCRNDHMRSKISDSAITEAKISGQIGQPAAWMIDHTSKDSTWGKRDSSVATTIRQAELARSWLVQPKNRHA